MKSPGKNVRPSDAWGGGGVREWGHRKMTESEPVKSQHHPTWPPGAVWVSILDVCSIALSRPNNAMTLEDCSRQAMKRLSVRLARLSKLAPGYQREEWSFFLQPVEGSVRPGISRVFQQSLS